MQSSRFSFRVGRRVVCALLCAAVLVPAWAAQGKEKGGKPFKVVTSFTILADMARNVAGDAAQVESLLKPGAEVHGYQPTPGDLMRMQGAQLVLYNGMGLETWFEKFLRRLKNVPAVVLTDGIEPIAIAEGPYKGKPNPHAWMSPTLALRYVDNIRDALIQHDAPNAQTYRDNAERYKAQIGEAIGPIRQTLEAVPEGQRWLVTSEGAFSYMARDFGLRELYLWPINADQQGTPQQVRRVIDTMRAEKIGVIFSESTISPEPAEQVARESGARYGGVLYVDSLSAADGPVPTYLDLLRVTAQTISQGLAPQADAPQTATPEKGTP